MTVVSPKNSGTQDGSGGFGESARREDVAAPVPPSVTVGLGRLLVKARVPQVAGTATSARVVPIPRDEGLLLQDERDRPRERREQAAVDERQLEAIEQQVAGGESHVGVEAGDAHRVIVVPHQPGALVVGIPEVARQRAGRIGQPRHDRRARRAIGAHPVEGAAIAHPRHVPAVKVDRDPILLRAYIRARNRHVDRQRVRQRVARAVLQAIDDLDADGPIAVRDDQAPEIPVVGLHAARDVRVPPQPGACEVRDVRRALRVDEVGVEDLAKLPGPDDVVVDARVPGGVGCRHRDAGGPKSRQRRHELAQADRRLSERPQGRAGEQQSGTRHAGDLDELASVDLHGDLLVCSEASSACRHPDRRRSTPRAVLDRACASGLGPWPGLPDRRACFN